VPNSRRKHPPPDLLIILGPRYQHSYFNIPKRQVPMQRRDLLKATAVAVLALAAAWTTPSGFAEQAANPREHFDFNVLKNHARTLAGKAFVPASSALPGAIARLNWDQMQAIRFRDDHALWRNTASSLRVKFFHLGLYNRTPVRVFEVVNGEASPINYDPDLFDYGKSGVDGRQLPKTLGFAGFQLLFHDDWKRDVAAFQGASYFRAVSGQRQYGMSARGLAIDCGRSTPEEFPTFTAFWLERPDPGAKQVTAYALLDSPSATGAYRFVIAPGETQTMDVDAIVYPRTIIEHVGVAPLTSMFQCGENDRRVALDFRPEIHDSDGLSICTGAGEWIWRPVVNPPVVHLNSFLDDNPRGFGLLQRDRNFDHYQDDGVFYDRRPSVWVEPKTDASGVGWGRGAVQLVEIPTADETFDNLVAFWHPAEPLKPGEEYAWSYRLSWCAKAPSVPPLATVRATRTGIGGVVGQPRRYYSWRFVVDFAGGELAKLPQDAKVEPVIHASRGEIEIPSARPLTEIDGWRAIFDLKPTDESVEPIDLRLQLRAGDRLLSETWLYQWTPPAPADRKF
jgi:glucans biosynthesis protein